MYCSDVQPSANTRDFAVALKINEPWEAAVRRQWRTEKVHNVWFYDEIK